MLPVAGCRLQVIIAGSIQPSSHSDFRRQQQIRAEPLPFHFAKLYDFAQAFCAAARDGFAGITTTEDFWRIEKGDPLRQAAEQK
jgi:hypothetical protein